jgi:hypothetical protein
MTVLESAHLTWKLRCERTIKSEGSKEKLDSETEIYNKFKWVRAISMRLKFDRLLSARALSTQYSVLTKAYQL